ncbi:MAG TPA: response regulator [Terriglobia bacterium]|nr:response regulator [Terriglobia bacterium]
MKRTILIIDDEDDIREVAGIALECTTDWRVLEASCGAKGIALAQAEHPDAVLLDLMMPDMDGMTVLARLKAGKRTAETPVILLTANVQAVRQLEGKDAAGVIVKPFDPLRLARDIAGILGWPVPAPAP